MSFDKPTRNRLAKFVADARRVIADEFTEQFQSLYGISAKGEVTALDRLGHLDEAGLATAALLRERIDYLEKTHPDDKDGTRAAVARLAREQAFTILNRLAAIRMAEKRDLIVESVGKGYQSRGFKVYETIAGSALGDAYHRYRRFLFCLFDELAIDLGILFDRRSPQALLFPREPALLALLDLLNGGDLEALWAEDETIGWIYQYYNDPAERKKMREESAAPRNSRELAVRNQFFTPRYVVEFLTDNTLGRIWYEMTKGQTRLREQCRYLVRRPTEIFLRSLEAAYLGIYGKDATFPDDLAHDDAFAALYSGNLEPAASGYPGFFALAGGALSNETFRAVIGEDWEQHGNECIDDLRRAILDGVEHPKEADLVWLWAAVSQYIENSQIGSPYALETTRKLETYFRNLLQQSRETEGLSQEDLLKQPVLIPHRPLKDPREIRLLDPACGSMHFGLYAFDLFETIYEEAWDMLNAHGGSPAENSKLKTENSRADSWIHQYASKQDYLRDVPKLIIENNLHGIDIDPRAVQIAGLSLWLRAQKAWQMQGVRPADRPRVLRSNIVCAEPMPGSPEMLEEFVKTLDPPLLGELVKTVFEKMELAGEAGSLLKIEEEIRTAIDAAKKAWEKLESKPRELFSTEELNKTTNQPELSALEQAVSSSFILHPSSFWKSAEEQLISALKAYAESADSQSYQRRLFADDAARGFAFIDLCRKRYDAVVMNPPFGAGPKSINALLKKGYADVPNDLFCQFVDRGGELTDAQSGKTGCITNSSFVIYNEFQDYRQFLLKRGATNWMLDLGEGVLDAYVGAAAYIFDPHTPVSDNLWIADLRKCESKAEDALSMIQAINANEIPPMSSVRRLSAYQLIPGCSFCHWAPDSLWKVVTRNPLLQNSIQEAGVGAAPVAEFFRLRWEIPPTELGFSKRWTPLANAGYFAAFYRDDYLSIDWKDDGRRAKAELTVRYPYLKGNVGLRVQRQEWYGRPGLVFGRRTDRFTTQPLCEDSMFSFNGIAVFPSSETDRDVMLALLNSRFVAYYINLICGLHKNDVYVRRLPCPPLSREQANVVGENARSLNTLQKKAHGCVETSTFFVQPSLTTTSGQNLRSGFQEWRVLDRALEIQFISKRSENDRILEMSLGVDEDLLEEIQRDQGPDCSMLPLVDVLPKSKITTALQSKLARFRDEVSRDDGTATSDILRVALGVGCSPTCAATSLNSHALFDEGDFTLHSMALCSWLVGTAFGRWDIRYATGERQPPELPDPFDPLPVCPPGMLQGEDGLPLSKDELGRMNEEGEYPLRVTVEGILVDDENHPEDIVARVREAIEVIWGKEELGMMNDETEASGKAANSSLHNSSFILHNSARAESIEQEACEILGVRTLRDYFRRPSAFFADHLKRYSKSRRQAPIYWPLSTKSGSYTLWLYYHRLTDQTLHTCLADFLDPKIRRVQAELDALKDEGGRLNYEGKNAGELRDFLDELKDLHDEIERVIKLPWRPNLNDGVLITASPLHKLFRLPKWQKDLKACWDKLAKGDYDWAHLAYTIWPTRVEKACERDRSIAIAHNREDLCKVEAPKPKKKRAKKKGAEEDAELELMEED